MKIMFEPNGVVNQGMSNKIAGFYFIKNWMTSDESELI